MRTAARARSVPFTITYIIDDTKAQQGLYSSNGAALSTYCVGLAELRQR
jgi:hypothetical protein